MKIHAVKTIHRSTFWWVHILVTAILGVALAVGLSSPQSIRVLSEYLLGKHRESASSGFRLITPARLELLLLYAKYFVWSYALVFCLAFLMRGSLAGLKTAFSVAAVFETVIFLVQFFFFLHGTFYGGTVLAILLGDLLSALTILIHERALI